MFLWNVLYLWIYCRIFTLELFMHVTPLVCDNDYEMNNQDSISCLFVVLHAGESGVEEWSQWSTCSVTCGQGSQVRTRTCVSPYGTHCSGPLRESRVCNNTALCPGSVSSNYDCGCFELCRATHLEQFVIFIWTGDRLFKLESLSVTLLNCALLFCM